MMNFALEFFLYFRTKRDLNNFFFTSISKNNSESLNNMCGLSRSRLAVCVATLLSLHFESSLTIRFKSGFSRFPLHLSLLGHSLVNALHFENVLHFRFFIVLQECKSANFLCLENFPTVWFNRKISAARPSAIVWL